MVGQPARKRARRHPADHDHGLCAERQRDRHDRREIDPALSALAGQSVTIAAVPIGTTNPTLASFVATAGKPNPSQLAQYRSLRGQSRPYEFGLTGNKVLTPWLALSFNGRLGWTADERLSGLPSARFKVPIGHPNSPFSSAVSLIGQRSDAAAHSNSTGTSVTLAMTLNATFGDWRATLAGKYDDRARIYSYDTIGRSPAARLPSPPRPIRLPAGSAY